MGNADQFIEIADADLVLGQDDDVVRLVDLIVKEIAFHAVNDLDVVGLIRRNFLEQRERLDDAVVGDGDGRMAPLLDSLDELLDRDQASMSLMTVCRWSSTRGVGLWSSRSTVPPSASIMS